MPTPMAPVLLLIVLMPALRVGQHRLACAHACPAGLLPLLRSRLWAVLWEEPGTPSASTARQQTDPLAAALKREFSFVGGQLYGDLYDRNCRRWVVMELYRDLYGCNRRRWVEMDLGWR